MGLDQYRSGEARAELSAERGMSEGSVDMVKSGRDQVRWLLAIVLVMARSVALVLMVGWWFPVIRTRSAGSIWSGHDIDLRATV
jgi:hypothetical protein